MDRRVGRKRTAVAERLLQHHQQTHHHGEEGGTFHESGGQDHVGAEVVDGLRLTGHGLHSVTTDAADANTSAKGGETSTEGGDTVTGAEVEKGGKQHVYAGFERVRRDQWWCGSSTAEPMYMADRKVNTYAWMKATSSSSMAMKTVKAQEPMATP